MTDAMQWLIDLLIKDISVLASGLIVLTSIVQFLAHFKEWLQWNQ